MIDSDTNAEQIVLDPSKLLGFDQVHMLDEPQADLIKALDDAHNKIGFNGEGPIEPVGRLAG